MSLSVLVDMNLSPQVAPSLTQLGWPSTHWSQVGEHHAQDRVLMEWARVNAHVVLTHDLDFGTLLALTHAAGPSVIQLRDIGPAVPHLAAVVASVLAEHQGALAEGALVVVDSQRKRVRILPL